MIPNVSVFVVQLAVRRFLVQTAAIGVGVGRTAMTSIARFATAENGAVAPYAPNVGDAASLPCGEVVWP
jgi:hypothetical protein